MVFKKKVVKPKKETSVIPDIAKEVASSDPEEIAGVEEVVLPVKNASHCAEEGCYEPRVPGARSICQKHI